MSKLIDIHNEAMDLALLAKTAKERGELEKSLTLFSSAFEKESEAARIAESACNPEPGLSILFRSAAWLAINANKYAEAEQLTIYAMNALKDSPLIGEFREILVYIYGSDLQNNDKEEYRLRVPKSEAPLFRGLMDKLGWSFSSLNAMKRIAVL